MAKQSKAEQQSKIIQNAVDCLESYQDRENENILRAEEAIRFRSGEQWPSAIRNDRENEHQDGGPRPCPVLDKTNQYIRQVVNEERQNRAAIRVRPVDDNADPETAEIFNGIIRHIEDASEAITAYTTAGEHAVDGGFGYFRLLTEYCDPMSFEQDIRIKRIHNRFSVALGPHTEPDGADAKEALIWEDMRRSDFKAEYPKAKEVSFEDGDNWADKDTIRIAEYMCIKPEATKIHQLEDGNVITDDELEAAKAQGVEIPEILNSRETVMNKVKWYKITSAEILEEKDLIGQYIPVIKVTGNELTMPDGKIMLSGMVETMKDPQRLHNYAHAGFIEHVALAPRAPWIAETGQVEDYEEDYADANRKPISLLKYDATSVDGHVLPPPQRTPPAGIAPGWQQMMQNTEHGIEASVGMYGPTVGAQSQEKSGIALQEQKSQGMVGNFHFPDNLSRSIQHCGRILVEWIPKVYDTERVARILGEDGEQELVSLNPEMDTAVAPMMDEFGRKVGKIYNLNVGKYDVTVSTGPSYTAKRQEAAENQIQVLQARPELLEIIGDIVFKNMDWPQADEIADRMKAILPPEIRELENKDEDGEIDPRAQAMMQQVEQAAQMIEERGAQLAEAEKQVEAAAQAAGADMVKVDAARKELESARKVFMAEIQQEEAELKLQAMLAKQEIDDALGDDDEDDIRLEIKRLEVDAQDRWKDREMRLKEHESRMSEQPREDTLAEALNVLGQQVSHLTEASSKPKPLNIQRNKGGEIISVNGRAAVRDKGGNLIGLSDDAEPHQQELDS